MRKKLTNIKKTLAYFLVGALSVSMLAGCGSKTGNPKGSKVDIELTEVLENVVESVMDIESIGINVKGEADISVADETEKGTVQGGVELSGKAVKEEPAFELKGNVSYKVGMDNDNISGERSITAYGETNSDEMEVYVKLNDEEWEKDSTNLEDFYESVDELEEILDEVKTSISKINEEQLKEFEAFIKLEDTTTFINNKECYVLAAEINDGNLIDLLKLCEKYGEKYYEEEEEDSELSPYISSEYEDDDDSFFGMDYELIEEQLKNIDFKLEYKLYFDKKSYFPVKFDYGMTFNGIIEETEIHVNKLKLQVDFSVNDVKVSQAPDEVKEAAVEEEIDLDYFDSELDVDLDGENDDDELLYDYADDNEESDEYAAKWGLEDGYYDSVYTKMPEYVTINGVKIDIPNEFSVLDALDLVENEEGDLEEEIQPKEEGFLYFATKDEEEYFAVSVYNSGNTAIAAKECQITGIGTGILDSELDNGIKIGDSITKVKEVYAGVKPSDTYNSEMFCYCTYEDKDENEVQFMFDYETGTIIAIEFSIDIH